jgi:outer membrane protein
VEGMRQLMLSLLVAGSGLVGAFASSEQARLTLEDALRLAESDSLGVLLSREFREQASEAAIRARASLLPQLSADAAQRRTEVLRAGTGGSGANDSFSARLNARLLALDPLLIATLQAARVGEDVSTIELELAAQQAMGSVGQVFFTHLRNLERFEVIASNIDRAEVLLDLARSRLEAGVATQIDVTRAEAQLAIEEQSRLQQETVVFESSLQLKRLLGLEPNLNLVLVDFPVQRSTGELLTAESIAVMAARPDVRAAERLLQQNRLERRAADWARLPSLTVSSDLGYSGADPFDDRRRETWGATAGVSVPIFEGGRIASNRRLAESRIRAQEFRLEDLRRQVESELSLAAQNARSRLAQIRVAETNLSLADEELRLARLRFETGVADNREVVEAQNNLARATDNLVEAVFAYRLSRLEWARARGDVRLILGEQAS